MNIIHTQRLILRTWQDQDAEAYYCINQDPQVIEFLRGPMTMSEVNDFLAYANQQFAEKNYTLWAAEEKSTGNLIGFIGLNYLTWSIFSNPKIEIGWRLGAAHWGKGYATEGAKAVLKYGFRQCGLNEIIAFTVPANIRSRRVMEKIGMQRDLNGDFAHPKLPIDHPLSKHILYKIINRVDFTQLCLIAKRIKLIPIDMRYAKEICKNFTAEITVHMWPSAPKSQAEINQHILNKQNEMQNGEEIALLIIDKITDEFLGYASLHLVKSMTPEMGIWLKKAAQGHQYGFEALNLLKTWAETNLSYDYLKYPVAKQNFASRKLAEKLGGTVAAEYIKTSESGNLLDEVEYRFYQK